MKLDRAYPLEELIKGLREHLRFLEDIRPLISYQWIRLIKLIPEVSLG